MKKLLGGLASEKFITLAAGSLGCLLLVLSWANGGNSLNLQHVALASVLIICMIVADRFPIHIRYATKVSLITVPLFLMMALLPLPLALLTAGGGIVITDIIARIERGLRLSDFIQDSARWIMILFACSAILHLDALIPLNSDILLVAAAVAMYVLDVATFCLLTSLQIRDTFISLVREGFSQTYEIETIQYLIGILGALAFQQAAWSLAVLIVPVVISYRAFKNIKEMNNSTRELLVNTADTVDLRDPYTGGHSKRVAELVIRILNQLEISGVEADLIHTAARLHDIGKIGIPDAILLKGGPLNDDEWVVMRSHPQKGADFLGRYVDFVRGHDMVLYHHERWDGKGYPRGLKGSEIPFGARVIAVADAFDAITTDRPYRRAKTLREAAEILTEGRGTQWNQEVVDALLTALIDELAEGIERVIE